MLRAVDNLAWGGFLKYFFFNLHTKNKKNHSLKFVPIKRSFTKLSGLKYGTLCAHRAYRVRIKNNYMQKHSCRFTGQYMKWPKGMFSAHKHYFHFCAKIKSTVTTVKKCLMHIGSGKQDNGIAWKLFC